MKRSRAILLLLDSRTHWQLVGGVSQMMRLLFGVLLCLLPSIGWGQSITIGERPSDIDVVQAKQTINRLQQTQGGTLTVGSQYTTAEVDTARKTLAAMEPKSLIIKVGEFEVIEPGKTVTSPLLWVVQDETLLERITVPANQPFALWMIRRGETMPRLHLFQAQPFTWAILVAKKGGSGSIQIIRNGDAADKPPVIVDRIDAVVGGGEPKPVDPPVTPDDPKPVEPKPGVDSALVTELKGLLAKDKAAAIGDQWKYAAIWAESFADSSKLLKLNDPAIAPKTLADLYAKHKAAWMADDVPVMPFLGNTRTRVATMLEKELGKDPAASLDRVKASEVYLRIGNALKEALK